METGRELSNSVLPGKYGGRGGDTVLDHAQYSGVIELKLSSTQDPSQLVFL